MPRGVPKHNRNISLRGIDSQIIELQIKKNLELEKALTGNDPQQILKAQQYIQSQQKENKGRGDQKSWLFQPDDSSYTGKGYKEAHKSVSFESLKKMSELFVVRLIHDTRIDQVKNFLHFTTDDQKEGFTLKRKRGLFDAQVSDLSKSEQKEVTEIIKFLEGCGNNSKWDNHDDFHEFISKILRDSLTYDQLSFENVRDRGGKLQKIIATDSSLVRLLNSQDPRYYDQFKALEYKGYLPKYCMAHMGDILIHPVTGKQVIFYPWELGFGVRNKTTDVNKQGYGIGELEVSMQLVTYILWSFQYNGNFFKQGSQPKGFINIKDGNMDNTTLNDFKDNWRQLMTSVHNSHKTPVFEGIDLEWIDLQKGNRDMEFNQWVEFLLVIFCSTYRIDPSELGFNFAQASNMFGQDGQKERLNHSKSKGLKPLLRFLEGIINKYIVREINENYEFIFTGVDIEGEDAQVELDGKKLKEGMVSFESMFEKYSGRKYNKKTDTILNQIFQQSLQSQQFGGSEMNGMVDENAGEDGSEGVQNPFDNFSKSEQVDPIVKSATDYINKAFSKGK